MIHKMTTNYLLADLNSATTSFFDFIYPPYVSRILNKIQNIDNLEYVDCPYICPIDSTTLKYSDHINILNHGEYYVASFGTDFCIRPNDTTHLKNQVYFSCVRGLNADEEAYLLFVEGHYEPQLLECLLSVLQHSIKSQDLSINDENSYFKLCVALSNAN